MKHQNSDSRPARLSPFPKTAAFGLAALLLSATAAFATNYSGNGATDFGGPIGLGVLGLTDDGTNITGTLSCANRQMNDVLVIYIDTGAGGGFADTSGFADANDGNRKAISGYNGTPSQRTVMTFATGFSPQFALSLGPGSTGFSGLWGLANGGGNSLPFVTNVNMLPNNNAGPYTFTFSAANIGLTPGVKKTFKIFGTLIANSAYRSQEAIAGNDSGPGDGYNPFTQTAFATYTFDAGAPTLTPITFQVDMSTLLTNGFNPAGGDTVNVTGSFVAVPGTLFQLTNNPTGPNPAIYSGTYQDANPTNTAETYRFDWIPSGGSVTNTEDSDARPFTVQPGGQTLPLAYFSDFAAAPSATTNSVTFQVDMTDQIALGTFNPSTEQVEVYGTFNQNYQPANTVPVQWTQGMGLLTNNPAGDNTNLYSGTFSDGNYPGSWEQYKFVILNGSASNYESIANRDFTTPNGSTTLLVAFFNNVTNVVTVPVTFQVDMTSQVDAGNLSTNGTTVNASVFNSPQFAGGPLTNNPEVSNTNIYSGTFLVTQQPGTVFQYKFTTTLNNVTTYEQPISTAGNNRLFTLASSAQTLPLVFWSDQDPNNILPAPTTVTFTIDMNGAVDDNGVPFNPSSDAVLINGTFLPGGFLGSKFWTDPFPSIDYPQLTLAEVGLTTLYTNSYVVPGGIPLEIDYKYGIYHGVDTISTNIDNEAPPNDNHVRFIRVVGAYSFPTDKFGSQTNNPNGNEISFGNLTLSQASPGQVAINWLGRPGVFLQSTTNLSTHIWTTVPNSGGLSATNISSGASPMFFRLVNP